MAEAVVVDDPDTLALLLEVCDADKLILAEPDAVEDTVAELVCVTDQLDDPDAEPDEEPELVDVSDGLAEGGA